MKRVTDNLATEWRYSQSLHRFLTIACFQLLCEQQLDAHTHRGHT